MIKRPFREHHFLEMMYGYEERALPLDLWIHHYFRAHPALGSKDRAFLAETIYGITRWLGALDYLAGGCSTWEKRLEIFLEFDYVAFQSDASIPPHVRVSFPQDLFECFVAGYGEKKALELCYASNFPAPTTVRVNPLKITREELLERWKTEYEVAACDLSPWGIRFDKKINFFTLSEFKSGFFEVQDEASQLVANLLEASPGQQVLDYCSGSGGKTLAFAHRLQQKGQIYLHDIRTSALLECRKRLKRAGIQNAQIVRAEDPHLKKLKKQMDWVFADVPCSGTGTLRRNPDMKWKFDTASLTRLCGTQRQIFEKALSFVKPGGKIIYATCSILKEENEVQIDHFLKTYDLTLVGEIFQSFPVEGAMDGFFAAVMQRKQNS